MWLARNKIEMLAVTETVRMVFQTSSSHDNHCMRNMLALDLVSGKQLLLRLRLLDSESFATPLRAGKRSSSPVIPAATRADRYHWSSSSRQVSHVRH